MPKRLKRDHPYQPRLGKPRVWLGGVTLEDAIKYEVEATAARFGVSQSWVIAVALADAMGIELDPKQVYYNRQPARRRA